MHPISKLLDAFQRSTGVDPRKGGHVLVVNLDDYCTRLEHGAADTIIALQVRGWIPDGKAIVMSSDDLAWFDRVILQMGRPGIRLPLLGVGEWEK